MHRRKYIFELWSPFASERNNSWNDTTLNLKEKIYHEMPNLHFY
jgi:hypothetical protein